MTVENLLLRFGMARKPKISSSQFNVDRNEYLGLVREQFGVHLLYYPGSGYDRSLIRGAFGKQEVIHLDRVSYDGSFVRPEAQRMFVLGDYNHPPFEEGIFDGVFFQDIHFYKKNLDSLLLPVKKDGIIILSFDGCKGASMKDYKTLLKRRDLGRTQTPYFYQNLVVFQRTAAASSASAAA